MVCSKRVSWGEPAFPHLRMEDQRTRHWLISASKCCSIVRFAVSRTASPCRWMIGGAPLGKWEWFCWGKIKQLFWFSHPKQILDKYYLPLVNFHLGWLTKKAFHKSPENSASPAFYAWDLWGVFWGDQPKWKIRTCLGFQVECPPNDLQFWLGRQSIAEGLKLQQHGDTPVVFAPREVQGGPLYCTWLINVGLLLYMEFGVYSILIIYIFTFVYMYIYIYMYLDSYLESYL